MKKYLLLVIGLILCTLMCVSCFKAKPVREYKAKFRTINASYNTGDINVFVDYEKIYETNIQYLNYSYYRELMIGKHKVQVKDANENILIDTSITMSEYRHYSLFIYDFNNTVQFKIVDENYVTPVGSHAKVRFLHLSNNAPVVNVHLDNDTTPMFADYVNGTNSEYIQIHAGVRQFTAFNGISGAWLTTQNPYEYKAGAFYTLYLRGNNGGTGDDSLAFFCIENTNDYL